MTKCTVEMRQCISKVFFKPGSNIPVGCSWTVASYICLMAVANHAFLSPFSVHLHAHNCQSERIVPRCSVKRTGRNVQLSELGHVRAAQGRDLWKIVLLASREGMNPLIGTSPSRFVVFEAAGTGEVVGGCQVRAGTPGELSTLVVDPAWRGRGIGTALVAELMRRFGNEQIALLTLDRTEHFYRPHGFRKCDSNLLPATMRLERFLGTFVAAIAAPGCEVIGMIREPYAESDAKDEYNSILATKNGTDKM